MFEVKIKEREGGGGCNCMRNFGYVHMLVCGLHFRYVMKLRTGTTICTCTCICIGVCICCYGCMPFRWSVKYRTGTMSSWLVIFCAFHAADWLFKCTYVSAISGVSCLEMREWFSSWMLACVVYEQLGVKHYERSKHLPEISDLVQNITSEDQVCPESCLGVEIV